MFDRDYNFKGRHANIVTQLTTEIDSVTKFKLFERNIDVLIIAPIVGYLYGRKSERDESGQVTVDNVKKINYVVQKMDIKITRYLNNKFIIFLTFYTDYGYDKNDYSGMIEFAFNLDDYLVLSNLEK